MRHVSRTHRVALDWLFDRINLDSKIQIKYIDTKNQLADILTKGIFTRDEWNHLLTLFNISHFSSTSCIAAMAKRSQQDSGGERVTAKSRPMMNLIARVPSNASSSTLASPGMRSYGSQDPWSSIGEKEERLERPADIGIDRLKASDYYYHEQVMQGLSWILRIPDTETWYGDTRQTLRVATWLGQPRRKEGYVNLDRIMMPEWVHVSWWSFFIPCHEGVADCRPDRFLLSVVRVQVRWYICTFVSVCCYKISKGYGLPCSTSTFMPITSGMSVRIMPPHVVPCVCCRIKTNTLDASFLWCHNLCDVLQIVCDVTTARVSASNDRSEPSIEFRTVPVSLSFLLS